MVMEEVESEALYWTSTRGYFETKPIWRLRDLVGLGLRALGFRPRVWGQTLIARVIVPLSR